jgi:hypothetical protein
VDNKSSGTGIVRSAKPGIPEVLGHALLCTELSDVLNLLFNRKRKRSVHYFRDIGECVRWIGELVSINPLNNQ